MGPASVPGGAISSIRSRISSFTVGEITIEPYDPACLSPNAYDWRLGDTIRICDSDLDAAVPTAFTEQTIPASGLMLHFSSG